VFLLIGVHKPSGLI